MIAIEQDEKRGACTFSGVIERKPKYPLWCENGAVYLFDTPKEQRKAMKKRCFCGGRLMKYKAARRRPIQQ